MVLVGVKLPLLAVGWIIYRAVNDAPEPEFEDDDGGQVRAAFEPGPRTRGPHGSGPAAAVGLRRGDKGHVDQTDPARKGARRGA